ncbi:MAG: GAF domain-containing sensor histidine kinase [Ferrimicrobium sp.]
MRSVSQRSESSSIDQMPSTPDPEGDEWLEHLTGAHSGKPSFYAAWRRTEADLERSITALREMSTAFCATIEGAHDLNRAVVLAASRHFDADCVAIIPSTARGDTAPFETIALVKGIEVIGAASLSPPAGRLGAAAVRSRTPVQLAENSNRVDSIQDATASLLCVGLAVPLLADDTELGSLVVLPRRPSLVDRADIAILQILAQQIVVALRDAAFYRESESLREEVAREREDASEKSRQLESQNKQLQTTRLELLQERQHSLIAAERTRIATELHDSVVQHLISIGMNLEWCRRTVDPGGALSERLTSTHELSRSALARVRTTIFELSCMTGENASLFAALQNLAQMLQTQVQVTVRHQGTVASLSPTEEHAVFHFVQEAIFNAMRHGNAQHVWVSLWASARTLRISIADDSISDPVKLQELLLSDDQISNGISGMRQRVAEVGGHLEVAPRRGGGVRLTLVGSVLKHTSEETPLW